MTVARNRADDETDALRVHMEETLQGAAAALQQAHLARFLLQGFAADPASGATMLFAASGVAPGDGAGRGGGGGGEELRRSSVSFAPVTGSGADGRPAAALLPQASMLARAAPDLHLPELASSGLGSRLSSGAGLDAGALSPVASRLQRLASRTRLASSGSVPPEGSLLPGASVAGANANAEAVGEETDGAAAAGDADGGGGGRVEGAALPGPAGVPELPGVCTPESVYSVDMPQSFVREMESRGFSRQVGRQQQRWMGIKMGVMASFSKRLREQLSVSAFKMAWQRMQRWMRAALVTCDSQLAIRTRLCSHAAYKPKPRLAPRWHCTRLRDASACVCSLCRLCAVPKFWTTPRQQCERLRGASACVPSPGVRGPGFLPAGGAAVRSVGTHGHHSAVLFFAP
eukprot:350783-Chlamydomonas_euryale.AAC.7